ncbi:MAG TPA: M48 family metalloprotease [Candidatus Eisenbacteria bacterium]|nr:M48 family metalloprotease [Candidatus Eisenbacteria bacterium]
MDRFRKMRALFLSASALLIGGAIVIGGDSGCAVNPATGKRQINLVSSSRELAMGEEADPAIIAEYGLYGDAAVQSYVDSIGQKLGRVSHLPTLKWHFRVLDSPVVNAFALPGGYIYITRGIMAYVGSESQLAGILGHEIGHVTARHSAQQMTQQQIAGIGLLAGAIFVDAFRPYSGLAQQGLGLLFLKYSRDHETQADELGIQYAARAGYDPRTIPATYATLKRIAERTGSSLPNFLSTHPDPGDREVRTSQLAQATVGGAARNLVIGELVYRKRIEGLVFGDDPRQGYAEANRFYLPEMAIQLIFPDGWKIDNQPSAVVAQGTSGSMQMRLGTVRDTTITASQFVDSLRLNGAIVEASGRPENFRDFPAWVGTIVAASDQGQQSFAAGFVKIRGGQFLELFGRASDQRGADQIYASIRSVAALRDPAKLNVQADRLNIKPAKTSATFATVWSQYSNQAITLEDAAILNSARTTTPVPIGTPLKLVMKGARG